MDFPGGAKYNLMLRRIFRGTGWGVTLGGPHFSQGGANDLEGLLECREQLFPVQGGVGPERPGWTLDAWLLGPGQMPSVQLCTTRAQLTSPRRVGWSLLPACTLGDLSSQCPHHSSHPGHCLAAQRSRSMAASSTAWHHRQRAPGQQIFMSRGPRARN